MADMNTVSLTGRMVRDVEVKTTESGKKVASFSIAVNGFKEDDTNFINCVAWEKTVEILEKYAPKGKQVGITGRLQVRSWDDKDSGKKRSAMEVVVTNLTLLGSKSDGGGHESAPAPSDNDYHGKDTVIEDIDDKPIDLSEIPF